MPRKYARKPSPTNAPTDPFSVALTPMINAIVDARIATLMSAWLVQHGPQPVPTEPTEGTSKVEVTVPVTKPSGSKKNGMEREAL